MLWMYLVVRYESWKFHRNLSFNQKVWKWNSERQVIRSAFVHANFFLPWYTHLKMINDSKSELIILKFYTICQCNYFFFRWWATTFLVHACVWMKYMWKMQLNVLPHRCDVAQEIEQKKTREKFSSISIFA